MATEVVSSRDERQTLIQQMTEHDLLEVVEIEEVCGLSPWGWDAYHKELGSIRESIMLVARNAALTTGLDQKQPIIGFIVARQIADEVHINNVAVRPDFRRQGIGDQLLRTVLSRAQRKGARQAVLEVRAGNTTAQTLYLGCGFRFVGRRRRYYKTPVEDALLMAVFLQSKP